MKRLKLIFLALIISIGTFTSCSENDINNVPDVQESETVQTVIAELRTMYNTDGTEIIDEHLTGNLIFDFCFDFVFPIDLIYNDGTTVSVNSIEELITVIIGANNDLYIVGIVFPFNVEVYNPETNQVEIITINNEQEFITLLESCTYNEPCDCDNTYDPVCVLVETPNGNTITVTYPNECLALCDGFTPNNFVDCENDCNCPTNYDPVCVEVNGEVIEFQNYCFAECLGYDQSDMVDCENNSECEVDELHVTVGDCNVDGTYSISINFDYTGDQDNFNLYIRNNVLIGNYPVASLPLTIENFQVSGYDEDYIKVCFEGTGSEDCCEDKEWYPPNCNGGDCSITNLEVEVGECNPTTYTYTITIDFDYDTTEEEFSLYAEGDLFVGVYPLTSLPLTLQSTELYGSDYLNVCIGTPNNQQDCCQDVDWEEPDCGGNDLCYEYVFPVSLFLNGTSVTANTNDDIDEYLDLGYQLEYPIDIIYNNETITVQQGLLEGGYGERCDD